MPDKLTQQIVSKTSQALKKTIGKELLEILDSSNNDLSVLNAIYDYANKLINSKLEEK